MGTGGSNGILCQLYCTDDVASPVQNSRSPFRIIHVYLYTLVLKIGVMVFKSFLHKTPED